MTAEELMRFDWVRLVDDNTPRQVDWIRSGEVGLFWNKTVTPPYLEPIPLTPEILEKNGFVFIETDSEYRKMGGVWTGFWIYKGLELGVANLEHKGNFPCCINIQDSNIECKYVHQLQHALKLCGIEKEIIL